MDDPDYGELSQIKIETANWCDANGDIKRIEKHSDGKLVSVQEFFVNGLEKSCETYYPNGQLKTFETRNSYGFRKKINTYHPNGQLHNTIEYNRNGSTRVWGRFDENGVNEIIVYYYPSGEIMECIQTEKSVCNPNQTFKIVKTYDLCGKIMKESKTQLRW